LNSYQDAVKTFAPLGNAAWSDIGLAYPWAASLVRTGDLKTATAVLTAVEQQQLPPDTLLLIGQTWSQAGDYSRALQSFHRALQLNPELPKAHYNAGLACIYAGHPADAENELKAELAMFPQDNNTKYNLAYAYLLQSQPEKALPLLQEIVASDPSYADAQYQLGKLKLEDGKADEAVKHLEQAERTSPEKDYVHYQLQAAYRKLARTEDAERELALYKETKARNREKTLPHPSQTQ
jgi:Flp pilus assembly protein TadD